MRTHTHTHTPATHLEHDLSRLVHLDELVEEAEQAVVGAVGGGDRR